MNSFASIIKELSKVTADVFFNGDGEAFLYGSRARGDADTDSDWDVLVITDDAPDNDENYRKYAFPFAKLGWSLGEQITPLLYSKKEWNDIKGTMFYSNVVSDAIRL